MSDAARPTPAQTGPDEAEARLAQTLQEAESASAGRLQVLSLDAIKAHFGDRWPNVADKAQQLIRQSIDRTLSRSDVVVEVGELAFVLVFPNLAKEQAQVKTAAIARDISRKLIGESNADPHFDIGAVVAELPKGSSVDTASVLANITELLDVEEDLNAEKPPSSSQAIEAGITRAEQLERELAEMVNNVGFVFRPLWFVSKSALSTYMCLPVRDFSSQGRQYGYRVIDLPDEQSLILALDILVLKRCETELRAMQTDGRQFLLSCPVHFETLAGVSSRTRFLQASSRLPKKLQKYLVYNIVGLPTRVPQGRVLNLVSLLKPRARAVSARILVEERDFTSYVGTGIFAVGVDLDDWDGDEPSLLQHMDQFVANAGKVGLQTFIHGLSSLSMTTAAVCSGFDYIHTDIVLADVDAPAHVHKFTPTELFRELAP